MSKIRVLVSGFEAFGGETTNPTKELVTAIERGEVAVPSEVEISSVVLPVVFKSGFEVLKRELVSFRPSIVLAFGQAGGRSRIELERVAVNLMDAEIPDNEGLKPADEPIVANGENALFSTLPIRRLVEILRSEGLPAGISNSAGLYVCNDAFYRLQAYLKAHPEAHPGVLSGFIHVPYSPEQAAAKAAPAMGFSELRRALELILKEIASR